MQLFKITYKTASGENAGFSFGKTKKQAIANKPLHIIGTSKIDKCEALTIEWNVFGVIDSLNEHASHADNG